MRSSPLRRAALRVCISPYDRRIRCFLTRQIDDAICLIFAGSIECIKGGRALLPRETI